MEPAARAFEGMHCVGRAALDAEAAGADEVMVAGDGHHAALTQESGAVIGICVVADNVAYTEEALGEMFFQRGERRGERLEVAVDVAYDAVESHLRNRTNVRSSDLRAICIKRLAHITTNGAGSFQEKCL